VCADKQNSTVEKGKKKKKKEKKRETEKRTWNARDSNKQDASKQTIEQKENTKRISNPLRRTTEQSLNNATVVHKHRVS
jgi:hypothetical protein